jgi:Trypsin
MVLQIKSSALTAAILVCLMTAPTAEAKRSLRARDRRYLDTGDLFGDVSTSVGYFDTSLPEKAYGAEVPLDLDDYVPVKSETFGDERIIGGSNADASSSQFFTLLLRQSATTLKYHAAGCGATAISACHALTAAHCVSGNREGISDGVYIGAYEPFTGNSGLPFHFSEVSSVLIHPSNNPNTNQHDIAILTFATCMDTNLYTPAQLMSPTLLASFSQGQLMDAFGFGRTDANTPSSIQTLQHASLPYITQSTCNSLYSIKQSGETTDFVVYDDMICAGYAAGGKDSCQGDSGGPLIYYNQGSAVISGIVSWGVGCGRQNRPGVYSSIAAHYQWITDNVCLHSGIDQTAMGCLTQQNFINAAPALDTTTSVDCSSSGSVTPLTFLQRVSSGSSSRGGGAGNQSGDGPTVKFTCSRMGYGSAGYSYCTSKAYKSEQTGEDLCPAQCHPACIGGN